jgi:crotonobetainyl-CoA:carnitine CoA-transferase CaiB-like acyl-CoA transferase
VVVENYTPRVLEQYQLDCEAIRALSPTAIMVRMPGWGLTGSWRDRPAMTFTAEAVAGLTALSGYPDGEPLLTGTIVDPIASITAAFATLAAIRHRRLTGHGACIEVALCDVAAALTARPVIESSADGPPRSRDGNRQDGAAPQGMYLCADQTWVAVSVITDEHWSALCTVLDMPQWHADQRFSSTLQRRQHHDVIDPVISRWCSQLPGARVVALLRGAGIPAAPMATGTCHAEHAQLLHRGAVMRIEHPVVGRLPYLGLPLRLCHQPAAPMPGPAPLLGQHNHSLLTEIGCSPADIENLTRCGLIGDSPFGLPSGR